MLKTILVPLDGSELAERALSFASAASIPTAAHLVLVRVVGASSFLGTDLQPLTEAEAYLSQHAEQLVERGFSVDTEIPCGDSPASWIVEQVRVHHADLVVMSTHGRTGPGRWLLGSVAEAVVARSPVPVLVDRAWHWVQRELLLQDEPRLLVPLDGSPFAESALAVALGLADDLGCELVLTRVEPRPTGVLKAADGQVLAYVDQLEDVERLAGNDYLRHVADQIAEVAPDLPVHLDVRFGAPAEGIAESAADTHAALVIMATHGRTGFRRALMGSVAGRVLHDGTTPLVLVGPAAQHGANSVVEESRVTAGLGP